MQLQDVVVGLDEVGRGALAGPLVAGAVVLGETIEGLKDSKQLTRRQRERLDEKIRTQAVAYGLGWVEAQEVDAQGMTASVCLAFRRALDAVNCQYARIIIDGSYNYFPDDSRAIAIIKADTLIPAVSAASIIAKVARDSFMMRASRKYPGYGFEHHVGYGNKVHLMALHAQGACELHRRSFRPVTQCV